jgi:hypothetical protein
MGRKKDPRYIRIRGITDVVITGERSISFPSTFINTTMPSKLEKLHFRGNWFWNGWWNSDVIKWPLNLSLYWHIWANPFFSPILWMLFLEIMIAKVEPQFHAPITPCCRAVYIISWVKLTLISLFLFCWRIYFSWKFWSTWTFMKIFLTELLCSI